MDPNQALPAPLAAIAKDQAEGEKLLQIFDNDPFIQACGVDNLNLLGYIDTLNPRVEADFTGRVADAGGNLILAVHPVLALVRWKGLTLDEWRIMGDVLLLVSSILYDEAILPWFHGLRNVNDHDKLTGRMTRHVRAKHFISTNSAPDLWSFSKKDFPDDASRKAFSIWLHASLTKSVEWQFGTTRNMDPTDMGLTVPNVYTPGLEHRTYPSASRRSCGAKIIIRRQYLDILDGQLRTSEVAAEFSGHTVDDQSALLRTRFALANLMLHELAHAFWTSLMSSYDPLGPPGQKFDNPVEPYYCDDRLNELGYAFEQNVISGVTGGIGLNHCVSPYGSSIVRYPSVRGPISSERALASPFKRGVGHSTFYAVHMDWHQSLFTRRFWEQTAPSLGTLRALRPRREIGYRRRAKAELYSGESPGSGAKMPPRSPGSDLSVEDDLDPTSNLVIKGAPMDRVNAYAKSIGVEVQRGTTAGQPSGREPAASVSGGSSVAYDVLNQQDAVPPPLPPRPGFSDPTHAPYRPDNGHGGVTPSVPPPPVYSGPVRAPDEPDEERCRHTRNWSMVLPDPKSGPYVARSAAKPPCA